MIKVVLFDLYGTLAGFSPSRFEIQSVACAAFSIQLTPDGVLKGYALADAHMARQNAVCSIRLLNRTEKQRFFAEYERLVLKGAGVEVSTERAWEIWGHVKQIPHGLTRFGDVDHTMDALKSQGFTLGMISNIDRDGDDLANDLGLARYLEFTVTSREVGAEKPHPPIFLAALSKARSGPGEAVHVGDQLISDVEGARGVGINPVLLDRDGNHEGFEDCPRIQSLAELPGLLAS